MTPWLDGQGRLFNPAPLVKEVVLPDQQHCVVIDDVLANPEGVAAWGAQQAFAAPQGYPYPGLVCAAEADLSSRMADLFALHARRALGARRTLDHSVRWSLISTPPEALQPIQWQCHRDRVADDPRAVLFAASVLYLFKNPALGGTSFYRPRRPPAETDRMLADSQVLDAASFAQHHGVEPGYMRGSNHWFERVASVEAAWNRVIFYDGGLFHSADVDQPGLLSSDASQGRLTLNSFFTCRRTAA